MGPLPYQLCSEVDWPALDALCPVEHRRFGAVAGVRYRLALVSTLDVIVSLGIAAVVPRGVLCHEAELPRLARGCWALTREVAHVWPDGRANIRVLGPDACEAVGLHVAP
jgi:hypothetical protein